MILLTGGLGYIGSHATASGAEQNIYLKQMIKDLRR